MTYKWNYQSLTNHLKKKKDELAKKLNIHPIVAELLIQRGFDEEIVAEPFLNPQLSDLHNPFLMPDMHKAVRRIEEAIGNKERILVYGDYDVDGTTAVSLVYKFFRKITSNIDYYIPDRCEEGYGISFQGIDYALESDVKLIISVDCGIKAISKVAYAKEKGIDFIICDHHKPDEILPDAVAVIDAKRVDSAYPYDELSACGVGFKLVQAFSKANNMPFSDIEPLLDLVAVSIASDIVPITGENRVMMFYGLKQLNSNPSFGLRGIIEICGLTRKKITVSDIVFKIGPRINASGRMMNGKEAVELMTATDLATARLKSEEIDKYNDDRRELDKKITEEATQRINKKNLKEQKSIVLYHETWHKGIIGIVASRLSERFSRPVIVLTKSNGLVSGSARSIAGFDVYKAIESCKDVLENFGGHTYAVGLTLREENLPEFAERFNALSFDEIEPKMILPHIGIDAEITLNEITEQFVSDLLRLSPFGPENDNPIFITRNVRDAGGSRLVGKESHHIKLDLIDDTNKDAKFPLRGIALYQGDKFPLIKGDKPVTICYTVERNTHGRNSFIQLMVRDIQAEH